MEGVDPATHTIPASESEHLTHWPLGDLSEIYIRLILVMGGLGIFCEISLR